MAKEICADCEKVFEGGKNAFLCPECRKKRVEKGKRKKKEQQMNDRYLFKAKTCNGEWVTGLLAHKDNKYYISNKTGMPFAFEVRPDTICQCTGLKIPG